MMSANEFFDIGPDPGWLVDACGGEIANPNTDLEYFYHASSSSAAFLHLSHGSEAGPSTSVMFMDLDDGARPNVPSADIGLEEFEREADNMHLLQNVSRVVDSGRQLLLPMVSELLRPWQSTATTPIRVPARRVPAAPAADLYLRACKKRKRPHA